MKRNTSFTVNSITHILIFFLFSIPSYAYAVDFNTDVLDAADKQNIDFSRFSQAGYILPGEYLMQIMVNNQNISPSAFPVTFLEPPVSVDVGKNTLPQACLTPEMVSRIGLTPVSLEKVTYWNNKQCADLSQLPGVEIHPAPSEGMLYINIPQAWLEYSDASWLPPSRWDNGIPGLLFGYNINGMVNKPHRGKQTQSLGYNGATGINFGAWRLRADYQGSLNHTTGSRQGTDSRFTWNRFYMYRVIPYWHAKLTLGEDYFNSSLFSSLRYTGARLESDDRMLPPRLRGYAPQVSGIAD
ncbi:fimbria/pilus outer membrane usher protein, partial [Escherichia coli]|uniref:FimD/PapC N-terminal domain-containing protein n=1 Tax=Escherichia coli TaxID=562 RepID=UPI0021D3A458